MSKSEREKMENPPEIIWAIAEGGIDWRTPFVSIDPDDFGGAGIQYVRADIKRKNES